MATDMKKTITLTTADGGVFEVPEAVAMEFGTVKSFFIDNPPTPETTLPLPNVTSDPLSKIVDYCRAHIEFRRRRHGGVEGCDDEVDAEEKAYDEKFVAAEKDDALIELILAANYLDIKEMLEMLSQTMADRIKNKSVEYVRRLFGIESDFTPEEEANLRAEHAWAFEGVDEDRFE